MADTVLTELKIHDFDTLEQYLQHESGIGTNDIVFTPDMSAKLFLFKRAWADYLVSDMSWLRADTFSWHSGDVYKTAYEHLANDSGNLYAWASGAAIYYTLTETPAVGDNVYSSNVNDDPSQIESVDNGTITFDDPRSGVQKVATRDATGDSTPFVLGIGLKTDTIGGTTITYYLAQDGHKICLPDQESNIAALYESTGVAWYYVLDTENKRFKLPREDKDGEYLYFYVGNFEQSAIEQTAGITAETLNGKADADLGNITDAGRTNIARIGMPSDTYTDLTLGTSGSTYTAPADGWFVIAKAISASGQYMSMKCNNVSVTLAPGGNAGAMCVGYIPASKGSVVTINYNAAGATNLFRFVYAEGAKHLA